jgi:hypothetical protein
MYDDKDFNDTVTFTSSSSHGATYSNVARTIGDADTYTEIVQEFVYFLQNIGYNYIGGLVVLDQDGKELHTTDI